MLRKPQVSIEPTNNLVLYVARGLIVSIHALSSTYLNNFDEGKHADANQPIIHIFHSLYSVLGATEVSREHFFGFLHHFGLLVTKEKQGINPIFCPPFNFLSPDTDYFPPWNRDSFHNKFRVKEYEKKRKEKFLGFVKISYTSYTFDQALKIRYILKFSFLSYLYGKVKKQRKEARYNVGKNELVEMFSNFSYPPTPYVQFDFYLPLDSLCVFSSSQFLFNFLTNTRRDVRYITRI